jgi:hypothetical protein
MQLDSKEEDPICGRKHVADMQHRQEEDPEARRGVVNVGKQIEEDPGSNSSKITSE